MLSSNEICRARPILGTFVEIRARSVNSDGNTEVLHAAASRAFETIERVHRLMSSHDANSDVSRLNREAHRAPVTVDPWTYEVLVAAQRLSVSTGGIFDVAVGFHLADWGFFPKQVTRQEDNASAGGSFRSISLLEDHRVAFSEPLVIDLGGIAKGFAVDKAIESLRESGVESGYVNAGGEIRALGLEKIHLRSHQGEILPFLQLDDEAVATSSPIETKRSVRSAEVSALVNGRTREPVLDPLNISVRAPTCLIADGLTKVMFAKEADSSSILAEYGALAYRYQNGVLSEMGAPAL